MPGFRFFDFGADEECEQRRQSADKKERPPSPVRIDEAVRYCGQQVAQRVAFLQKPRNKSAPLRRDRLHSKRSSYAPLPAHSDAVEQTQGEKDSIARSKAG